MHFQEPANFSLQVSRKVSHCIQTMSAMLFLCFVWSCRFYIHDNGVVLLSNYYPFVNDTCINLCVCVGALRRAVLCVPCSVMRTPNDWRRILKSSRRRSSHSSTIPISSRAMMTRVTMTMKVWIDGVFTMPTGNVGVAACLCTLFVFLGFLHQLQTCSRPP